jgi:protein gp37
MWISDAGPGRYAGAEAIRCDMARHPRIHWVIAGPQTGPGSEPCDPEWVEALADQCACAKTPFFDKRHHFIRREFPKSTQA